MCHLSKAAVAIVLSAALVSAGTPPADPIVGILAAANKCNLAPGTTLFLNTDVWTATNGAATIILTKPSATLLLAGDSRLRLLPAANSTVVQLEQGILRFLSKQPVNLQVFSGSGLVQFRSQTNGISSGEIRILGKNRIAVIAVDAPISVEANGESVVVPKGLEYTLEVAPPVSSGPGPVGAGSAEALSKKSVLIVGISIAAIVTATALILAARADKSSVTFASPFIP